MINRLIGHSGCKLELIEDESRQFVRKTSYDLSYNQRLQKQFEKQSTIYLNGFRQTKVLNSGTDLNGLFYFDMEFIPGQTLAHYTKSIKISRIQYMADFFAHFFRQENTFHQASIFHNKIEEIFPTIKKVHLSQLKDGLTLLENFDWKIEKTENCHGDLSFENIIFYNDELFVIDFLDSFCDSWLIDIAKLLQDLETQWAYRHSATDLNISIRLEALKLEIFKKLTAKGMSLKQFKDSYYLLLLNLFRIIPYLKDENSEKFIIYAINKVTLKINILEKEYENINSSLCR